VDSNLVPVSAGDHSLIKLFCYCATFDKHVVGLHLLAVNCILIKTLTYSVFCQNCKQGDLNDQPHESNITNSLVLCLGFNFKLL
jgi:hypothetical protein